IVPDATSGHAQFGFDRLGLRVPAILVSPWVGEGVADHTVYDHTSLPATLKTMFDLPRFLTARDAAAATFEHNFLAQPRTVTLTDLSSRLRAASAAPVSAPPVSTPPDASLSQHQRSLKSLAEVVVGLKDGSGIDTHARDFLNQAESP